MATLTEVRLPMLGESVTEGIVSRWLKSVGDKVAVDEPLVEIATDKVDTEIPSPVAGYLAEIRANEDETVAVDSVLAVVSDVAPGDEGTGGSGGPVEAGTTAVAEPVAADQNFATQPAAPLTSPTPPLTSPTSSPDSDPGRANDYLGHPGSSPGTTVVSPGTTSPAPWPTAPSGAQPVYGTHIVPPLGGTAPSAPVAPVAPVAPASPAAPPAYPAHAADYPSRALEEPQLDEGGHYIPPALRKLAQQKGVDLDTVVGSGVGGRIRKQDVLEAAGEVAAPTLARGIPNSPVQASPVPPVASPAPVAAPVPAATAPSQPTQPPVYATPAAASPTAASPYSDPGRANDYLGRPGSSPGTAVASTTPAAASPVPAPATPYPPRAQQTSPYAPISAAPVAPRHAEPRNEVLPLTVTLEVDLTAIARGITQGGYIGTSDHVPFVIRAAAETLKEAPMLNAQLDGTLKYSQQVNIAVPMDTASGRVAPVLQNVGEMSLVNVINSLGELRGRASAGALLPADLLGATFTVVDYSASGVLFDTPVVTPPQVAALGVGACQRRPVVVNDPLTGESIGIRDMVYLSLTYDNRAIQISQASHFMHLLKSRLEAGA